MSVSGNMAIAPFPETVPPQKPSTARVRRYRATRTAIRVEVEVPTPDDALAIKRFARQRRNAGPRGAPDSGAPPAAAAADRDHVAALVAALPADALAAMQTFAEALSDAGTPELLARAERVAATYHDAVARAGVGRTVTD